MRSASPRAKKSVSPVVAVVIIAVVVWLFTRVLTVGRSPTSSKQR